LIAKAENPFSVTYDDDLDIIKSWIAENFADVALVRQAQEESAGFTENLTEMLAAQTDRRRINDWHHLFDIAREQAIKKNFIGVLQSPQKCVLYHVSMKVPKSVVSTPHLIFKL
jgi:hypothetical protein